MYCFLTKYTLKRMIVYQRQTIEELKETIRQNEETINLKDRIIAIKSATIDMQQNSIEHFNQVMTELIEKRMEYDKQKEKNPTEEGGAGTKEEA